MSLKEIHYLDFLINCLSRRNNQVLWNFFLKKINLKLLLYKKNSSKRSYSIKIIKTKLIKKSKKEIMKNRNMNSKYVIIEKENLFIYA